MTEMQPGTVEYATPRMAASWGRAGVFMALMPMAAAAGAIVVIVQGWGWDIARPLEDIQRTAAAISCPAVAAACLAVPFALAANKLRGLRLWVVLLTYAGLAFALGYALGKEVLIVLYA